MSPAALPLRPNFVGNRPRPAHAKRRELRLGELAIHQ